MTTLRLYRHILKACKTFPTKNRESLYEEIKREFAANRSISNCEEIERKRGTAIDGLERMLAFTKGANEINEWSVKLKGPDTRPLG